MEWDTCELWVCRCAGHTYSLIFVRYYEADDHSSDCVRCGSGPVRLERTTRLRKPVRFEVEP